MALSFREQAFRLWYWYVSTIDKNAEVIFMNFGYSDKDEVVKLKDEHEINRYSIQLYHHLAIEKEIKNKDIVEIGCGRGGGLSYITETFSPASAIGVDLNKRAISFCNHNYTSDNISFEQGDAQNLGLKDNSCDLLINVESSHRYPDFAAFLKEVHRMLRPGGSFLFTDFRFDYDYEGMKEMVAKCGLKIEKKKNINNEVLAALNLDDNRRRSLVQKLVPKMLHKVALSFAGNVGSETYKRFKNRKYIYFSYVLTKE